MNKFLIAVFVLLLVFTGCSKDGAPQATQEPAELALPDSIPDNVPIYPYKEVLNMRESANENGDHISFSLLVEGTVADINEWYHEALQKDGWSIKSDKRVAGYRIIQAENGDLYTNMQAVQDDDGTAKVSQQVRIGK